jgi:high-affinity iron transporter
MLASFLLALREGLEAALIIGIVLGALRKMSRADLAPAVWRGTVAASLVSIIAGVALSSD